MTWAVLGWLLVLPAFYVGQLVGSADGTRRMTQGVMSGTVVRSSRHGGGLALLSLLLIAGVVMKR